MIIKDAQAITVKTMEVTTMKKIICIMLSVITLFSFSLVHAEEINLSNYTFEELIALEKKIINEMVSRPEYKEVTVPLGVYKVGEEIPAGKWTISGLKDSGIVYWGKGVDEYGVEIPYNQMIADFTHWDEGDSIDWDLVEGTYIAVTISPVKFSPYIPKSLGF